METQEVWPPAPTLTPPKPSPSIGSTSSPRVFIALMWLATAGGFASSTFHGALFLPLPLRGVMTLACEVASLGLALFLVGWRDTAARLHGGARLGVSLLVALFGFLQAFFRL